MISVRRSIMFASAAPRLSRSERGVTRTRRSPEAIPVAAATISLFDAIIFFIASRSIPVSSRPDDSICRSDSPSASFPAMETTSRIGRVMLRVTVMVIRKTMRIPAMKTAHMVLRVRAAESRTTFSLEFISATFFVANSSSAVSIRRMSSLNGTIAAFASAGVLIDLSDICCRTDWKPIV